MDISMDIHEKSVDMDMDMDAIFHIHGNPAYPPARPDHYIALVLMNLFSVVENISCMHHHHNRPID